MRCNQEFISNFASFFLKTRMELQHAYLSSTHDLRHLRSSLLLPVNNGRRLHLTPFSKDSKSGATNSFM